LPAAPGSSCRSFRRPEERWSRRVADRPARGLHRAREIRSRSLAHRVGWPGDRAAARRPVRVVGRSPGPRQSLRPNAELPHPSVPEGTPERPRRLRRGWPWDLDSRTYVLSVKTDRSPFGTPESRCSTKVLDQAWISRASSRRTAPPFPCIPDRSCQELTVLSALPNRRAAVVARSARDKVVVATVPVIPNLQ
jgi:hypothetical protein